jgi:predicted AAA+ superfamily ATPase
MLKSGTATIERLCSLPSNNSFFLFGARGTGKTTLLKQLPFLKDAFYIDLLNNDVEERYAVHPRLLLEQVRAMKNGEWVIIDEIQKIPKLLDHVHILIEEKNVKFALTGSSSRKLKRGGADLLAGRAWSFSLFPFTSRELGPSFDIQHALQWGTLPKVVALASPQDKSRFLRTYAQTYLKEEILIEQVVRNLDPFRLFLPVAAQMNTQIVNYSNISRDTGVDYKTIQNYYQILVDTNLGYFLEPYSKSVRKVQRQSPKFYFFDMGVKRAIQRKLNTPLEEQTSDYGEAFESWFMNECLRLNLYLELDYEFSFLRTKDDAEIDLLIDRPGKPPALVEIKSGTAIDERHIRNLMSFEKDFPGAALICACRVQRAQKIASVSVLPWSEALDLLF